METNEICTLSHRSAAGRAWGYWEFIPRERSPISARIFLSLKLGNSPVVECEVPVCTNRSKPEDVPGRWVLVPKGEHTFILTAAQMPTDMQRIARAERFHDDLPVGSVVLTNAPENIAEEIRKL